MDTYYNKNIPFHDSYLNSKRIGNTQITSGEKRTRNGFRSSSQTGPSASWILLAERVK